jgi:hypothetical protein
MPHSAIARRGAFSNSGRYSPINQGETNGQTSGILLDNLPSPRVASYLVQRGNLRRKHNGNLAENYQS